MESKDILYNNDIIISSGDIKFGFSDQYHINDILEANKGQFYQYPNIGFGMNKLLNGQFAISKLKKEIRQELQKDNYRLDDVVIETDQTGKIINIEINAVRLR